MTGRGVKYWPAPPLVSCAFFSSKPSYARTQRLWPTTFKKQVADSNERRDQARGFRCGTSILRAAISKLNRRHARLLLFLLGREGIYIVNSNGQVFGFREIGGQFGSILERLDESYYEELSEIGHASFDELNLDDPLIREHFSSRAESFIAAAAEEGLDFFFIGAESNSRAGDLPQRIN